MSKSVAPPKAGQPPAYDFYAKLLHDYDQLVLNGDRAPGRTLAHKRGVPHNTLKGWLRRGRIYLSRETLPIPYVQHCPTCTC